MTSTIETAVRCAEAADFGSMMHILKLAHDEHLALVAQLPRQTYDDQIAVMHCKHRWTDDVRRLAAKVAPRRAAPGAESAVRALVAVSEPTIVFYGLGLWRNAPGSCDYDFDHEVAVWATCRCGLDAREILLDCVRSDGWGNQTRTEFELFARLGVRLSLEDMRHLLSTVYLDAADPSWHDDLRAIRTCLELCCDACVTDGLLASLPVVAEWSAPGSRWAALARDLPATRKRARGY